MSAAFTAGAMRRTLCHRDGLEAESVHLLHGVTGPAAHSALRFSGGRDSIVLRSADESRSRHQSVPPLDAIAENRATGAFILIDETTHDTVAAGLIQ